MQTYTVWSNGRKLGETTFELASRGNQHLGTLHPTTLGIDLLPGITAMMPALFGLKALCEREGINTDDDDPAAADAALAKFEHAPEGKRLMAAAKEVASLELRDAAGKTLAWKSILVSDVRDIVRLAAELGDGEEAGAEPTSDDAPLPMRYMISVTLQRGIGRKVRPFGVPAASVS